MAAILNSPIMDSDTIVYFSEIYSHLPTLVSPLFHKKTFKLIHIWLNLMMAAILNSAILNSDTAIMDSDTLLSALRFTQIHSQSNSESDSNSFSLTQSHFILT